MYVAQTLFPVLNLLSKASGVNGEANRASVMQTKQIIRSFSPPSWWLFKSSTAQIFAGKWAINLNLLCRRRSNDDVFKNSLTKLWQLRRCRQISMFSLWMHITDHVVWRSWRQSNMCQYTKHSWKHVRLAMFAIRLTWITVWCNFDACMFSILKGESLFINRIYYQQTDIACLPLSMQGQARGLTEQNKKRFIDVTQLIQSGNWKV